MNTLMCGMQAVLFLEQEDLCELILNTRDSGHNGLSAQE